MDRDRQSLPPRSALPVRPPLARLTLAAAATALVGATLWHLALVFLSVAPPNTVSLRQQNTINGHVFPEFAQNWQFFAPNPTQDNVVVEARVRVGSASGTVSASTESPWISLTARDIARIRHDPAPSHADQNMLRVAWDTVRRSDASSSKGIYDALYREYLKRIALQRLGRDWNGERIDGIQLRSISFPITLGGTGTTPGSAAPAPVYNTLSWWPVGDSDYEGLQ